MGALIPPTAKRIPSERYFHSDTMVDDYAWMADADHPDTVGYIAAENAYAEARTADQASLRDAVFNEILTRTAEADLSLPARSGGYWYYYRVTQGQQYETHCRLPVQPGALDPPATDSGEPLAGEQVLLDGDAAAGESEYFALGTLDVSPDGS
ncbi:MAG TPA: hypothetical protein VNF47_04155 [Streptosporangiaceae bacterium]|nr:hypothetical protein [Streptosporangiaceae bacterium]